MYLVFFDPLLKIFQIAIGFSRNETPYFYIDKNI